MSTWIWQPWFSPVVLTLLAIPAVGATLWRAMRSGKGRIGETLFLTLLRLGVIAALFFFLMGPTRLPEAPPESQTDAPPLRILLDSSGSMLTRDMEELDRWQFALQHWLAPGPLRRLQQDGTVQVATFDREAVDADPRRLLQEDDERTFGEETRLIRSLEQAVSDQPEGSTILVLSDGHDSMDENPARLIAQANARNIRIDTVPLGGPRLEQDLHVLGIPQQPYLIAGETGGLKIRVLQTNAADTSTRLTLTTGGETTHYPIRFDQSASVEIDLPVTHTEPGSYEYTLSVEPLRNELEHRNNHHTLFLDVIPERFRVLLIEGSPYWDTKFLAQTLRRDGRLELMQVSQIAPGRRETLLTRIPEDQASFPDSPEALALFDILILGRDIENVTGTDWLKLLPDYVTRQSGRILFVRGRAFDLESVPDADLRRQLRMLEPADLQDEWVPDASFHPASAGIGHPALQVSATLQESTTRFKALPALPHARVSTPGPGSRVLAEFRSPDASDPIPALVTQQVGPGQTLMVMGDGMWRWRMPRSGASDSGNNLYETFWSNTVRWMLSSGQFHPGAEISLDLHPRHLQVGQPVTVMLTTRLPTGNRFPGEVRIHTPDGSVRSLAIAPHTEDGVKAEARFTPEQTGVYRLEVSAPGLEPAQLESRINVYDIDVERLLSAARPDLLRLIARETGGTFLDPYRPEAYQERREQIRTTSESPRKPEAVWDSGVLLAGVLLLAGFEWIQRKRWGWT